VVDRIPHDEASIRRLACRLGDPAGCKPATSTGPTGFELAGCWPAWGWLPGDRALADPQGAGRQGPRPTGATLAGSPRLHRAGELVAIRIPTVAEEAVGDLCRARVDLVADRTRARHRLGKFQLAPRAGLVGRQRLDADP
jgi:transposase